MYRGTTPTITFNVNTELDLSELTSLWITFRGSYESHKEVTFTLDDVTIDNEMHQIILDLSQDQTLYFDTGNVSLQMRLLMSDGRAYASDIKSISIDMILKDGVIS